MSAITSAQQTDWPTFGNDPGAMRFSSLHQIDSANVAQLKPAWTFRTGKPGSEAIPIVVDSVMYLTSPDGVYALVPETGELLWKADAAPMALRGLAYWRGTGSLHSRVFAGNGHYLLALDTTTGKPAPGFGDEGRLDLKKGGLGELTDARYALQSPPAVFGDVVITGCCMGEGSPHRAGAYGDIRGLGRKNPANSSGPFTPFPVPASLVMKHGRRMPGRIAPAPTSGASSPSTSPAASFMPPSARPPRMSTVRTGSATVFMGTLSSRSTPAPVRKGGIGKSSTTTFGTSISPPRPRSSIFNVEATQSPPLHRSPRWACSTCSIA